MEEFLKLFNVRDIGFHAVNTLILFIAIRFLAYKPVRRFMDARAARVQASFDEAAAQKAEAEAALCDAEARRGEAEAAAVRMQADSAAEAQQNGEKMLSAAKAEAAEIVRRAKADADAQIEGAQRDIQSQALSMAVEIAEKMIGRELSERDNDALAREFLTKVV